MKMEAEADGMRSVLMKQAEGFTQIVGAAGGDSSDAVRLMLADKMEELVKKAETEMYEAKRIFYENGGRERRRR